MVVCSGLGTTAWCFQGHASLLEYVGVEENTAGERAGDQRGGPQHFTSQHEVHSAGPERPDEPSQQSGIHSLLTEIHARVWSPFGGSDTNVTFVLLSSPDEFHAELLGEAHLSYSTGTAEPRHRL